MRPLGTVIVFDGTLSGLIECYQTDPDSPFHKIEHATRENYQRLMRRLGEGRGFRMLAEIRSRDIKRWHEHWTESGVAMAHSLVSMLRTVIGFGATILEDEQAQRIKGILSGMRFANSGKRQEWVTAAQALAICEVAHAHGRASVALAQAIQFDLMLRQKDVIGAWVPMSDPTPSDICHRGHKWIKGIRWNEIDAGLILRHRTSKKGKPLEANLNFAPLVIDELAHVSAARRVGPVIVSEVDQLPYSDHEFRRLWRVIATEAGVRKEVFNCDSRAGGITEAMDAGAEIDDVRKAATHSNRSMTERYSRGDAEAVAKAMRQRMAHRERNMKPST